MPLTSPTTIRFDEEELAALKEAAARERRSIGFVVRDVVRRGLCLPVSGSNDTNDGNERPMEQERPDGAAVTEEVPGA